MSQSCPFVDEPVSPRPQRSTGEQGFFANDAEAGRFIEITVYYTAAMTAQELCTSLTATYRAAFEEIERRLGKVQIS